MSKIWESECPAIDKETEPWTQTNSNTHTVCMFYLIYGQLLSSSSWVSKSVGGAAKLIVQVIFTPHLIRKARLILRSISYHQRWKTKHKSVSIVQHLGSSDLTYSWDNTMFVNMTMTFKRYKKAYIYSVLITNKIGSFCIKTFKHLSSVWYIYSI